MRRFVPTIATLLVIALCVMAGNWQRARMHYKEGLKAQYDAASRAVPLRTPDVPRVAADWSALRYRTAVLEGTFDPRRQFLLDNKVHQGVVGYDVVAPLQLTDGRTLLVDRGWVPQGRSRAELPEVPPPAGPVRLRGRIELPARGYLELGSRDLAGPVQQHLDLERFTSRTGVAVLPILIQQLEPAGPRDALVRDWPSPDFGIDTHRIYMVQWYSFALLAAVFWAVAHWRARFRPESTTREAVHG